jgi:hypothetical protein
MWRRPRLVTADTKSPAPQPGRNAWWRGAFAPDPATGTEAGPGPTTPRRSAVRRASRLRGRCHCLASVASRVTARPYKADASRRSANPLARGSAATKEGKNPDAKRAGTEETGLFDMVNRKRRGAIHRHGAGAPSRQRQRARVPAERAPRRAFLREMPARAREPGHEDYHRGSVSASRRAASALRSSVQIASISGVAS